MTTPTRLSLLTQMGKIRVWEVVLRDGVRDGAELFDDLDVALAYLRAELRDRFKDLKDRHICLESKLLEPEEYVKLVSDQAASTSPE